MRVRLVVHNASTQHAIQVLWLSFEGNEVTAPSARLLVFEYEQCRPLVAQDTALLRIGGKQVTCCL